MTTTTNGPTTQMTLRQLAEIAEKSPGYSVIARIAKFHDFQPDPPFAEFVDIRFRRRNGRRFRAVVDFGWVLDGVRDEAGACSDNIVEVLD